MRAHPSLALGFVLSVLLAFLACCAPSEESRQAVLTFDGKTCHYEGPEILSEGVLTVTLVNESEYDADLWAVKIEEGKTWQDMLDHIGTPGSYVHFPEWSGGIMTAQVPDNPDAKVFTLTEGLYAFCCCTCEEVVGPQGVWPGASLQVKGK